MMGRICFSLRALQAFNQGMSDEQGNRERGASAKAVPEIGAGISNGEGRHIWVVGAQFQPVVNRGGRHVSHLHGSARPVPSLRNVALTAPYMHNGLLGAHLFGLHAEEVINLFALAIRFGLKADDLKKMPYAYPTSSSDVSYMV